MVGVEGRENPKCGAGWGLAFACLGFIFKASGLTVHPKPRWGFLQTRDLRRSASLPVLLVLLSATWESSVRWASWGICLAAPGFFLSVLDLALMQAPPAPRLFLHNSLYTHRREAKVYLLYSFG